MLEINIMNMKISEIDELSSATLGRSFISNITLVSIKDNQSFGTESSDGSVYVRQIGKIQDNDFMDSYSKHDFFRNRSPNLY